AGGEADLEVALFAHVVLLTMVIGSHAGPVARVCSSVVGNGLYLPSLSGRKDCGGASNPAPPEHLTPPAPRPRRAAPGNPARCRRRRTLPRSTPASAAPRTRRGRTAPPGSRRPRSGPPSAN